MDKALIAFTFVRKEMRDYASAYCLKHTIYQLDILGPLINNLSAYLRLQPLETPTLLRKVDERYFKRIDAIEYTLGHDDGRGAERLKEADIVLVGLSRTSKTPTSFYLAQEGFKVANVPSFRKFPCRKSFSKSTSVRSSAHHRPRGSPEDQAGAPEEFQAQAELQ